MERPTASTGPISSYGKFAYQVYDYLSGRWYTAGHIVRRIRWESGMGSMGAPETPKSPAIWCQPFLKGGSTNTHTSHAVTWSNGVDLSGAMKGVLGSVSLSSSSGFTREAHNHVAFTGRARLCGWKGALNGSPGALIARPR